MKKLVMKVDVHDDKKKKKVMQKVSGISGVISVNIDMAEKKLTVTGDVDAVEVANKLRKLCHVDLVTLGEDKKEDGDKNKDSKELKELEDAYMRNQYLYNNYAPPPYYYRTVVEERPSWWW